MLSNKKANKRVCPTLTLVGQVGRGCPSDRFLCMKASHNLRDAVMPGTNITFGSIGVRKLHQDLSLRGLGAICLVVGDVSSSGGVVGTFRPSIIVKANNCIYTPILCTTSGLNVPAVVRRRGSITKIAGGFLDQIISHVYVYFRSTHDSFSTCPSGVIFAKGPQTRRMTSLGRYTSLGRCKLGGNIPAILVFKNDQKTGGLGRSFMTTCPLFGSGPCRILLTAKSIRFGTIRRRVDTLASHLSGIQVIPCVRSVPGLFGHASLVMSHDNTAALARIVTLNLPDVLVPDPCIAGGRRRGGTRDLLGGKTTRVVLRGSLSTRSLFRTVSGLVVSRAMHGRVTLRTGRVNVASTSSHVVSIVLTLGG